ncbi:hypothetical protein COLINT_02748 [Collinsella intestinalis DSM 13280]|uniref:Uncharacterized protein n=1 Tax=Collinsella intestinalis DSM 13280 TaxID=521003 RepID=C4F9L3_9ACTN|nr:hypothetical protein COLINT_02748 [Collinsella intestinalis DSM 13280]
MRSWEELLSLRMRPRGGARRGTLAGPCAVEDRSNTSIEGLGGAEVFEV